MKLLIANRGEIARRIAKTAHRMHVPTVGVYSRADAEAAHVAATMEAVPIAGAASSAPLETYLSVPRVLSCIRRTGATHVHPGYGFLSESAAFARELKENNVTFVGPPVEALEAMGDKSSSKRIMEAAQGVPLVPGYHGDDQSDETLLAEAVKIGFPVMIKPSMGGGGKGMKISSAQTDFLPQLTTARREALAAFADSRVLLEKYVPRSRHIEVQVMCDTHGNAVHLYERDCSVQRRHQKLLEESPAPSLTPPQRRRYGEAAIAAARAVGYVGAGTVEFIADADDPGSAFYFCEMNTRLQVEHPVTECALGVDLVEWQLRVARGERLAFTQGTVDEAAARSMHAIEARLYAENPSNQFLPSTGPLWYVRWPKSTTRFEVPTHAPFDTVRSPYVRIDIGYESGNEMSANYDPMLGKLIAAAETRQEAVRVLVDALAATRFVGVQTNVEFLRDCASHPRFLEGGVDTAFMEEELDGLLGYARDGWWNALASDDPSTARAVADRVAAVAAVHATKVWADASRAAGEQNAGAAWAAGDGFRIARATPMPELVLTLSPCANGAEVDAATPLRVRIRRANDNQGVEVVVECSAPEGGGFRAIPGAAADLPGADDPREGDGVASFPTKAGCVRRVQLGAQDSRRACVHDTWIERREHADATVDGQAMRVEVVAFADPDVAEARAGPLARHIHAWVTDASGALSALELALPPSESAADATLDLEAASGRAAAGGGAGGALGNANEVVSPLYGKVARVSELLVPGASVKKGDALVWIESMKLEHEVAAKRDGVVSDVCVAMGEQVKEGQLLVSFAEE